MFEKASRMKGITGENLLQLCETRLDNVVFRLGIAPSRRAARQLVTHRHIVVNGEVVNIPSYQLRPGDSVGVREKSKSLEAVVLSLNAARSRAEWLDWDNASFSGKLINLPARELIPENIKEQLIVELYSK
jgi:small subunit ribosomal protein S4